VNRKKVDPRTVLELKRLHPTLTNRELGALLAKRMGRSTVYTDSYISRLLVQARRQGLPLNKSSSVLGR